MKNKKIFNTAKKVTAAVLAITMVGAFSLQKSDVSNAARMSGVEQVVTDMTTDPFTILEVVPDQAYASVGYYVTGQEPAIAGKLLDGTTGRQDRIDTIKKILSSIASDGQDTAYPAYYGDSYSEQLYAPSNLDGWMVTEFTPDTGKDYHYEKRTGYFIEASKMGWEAVGDFDPVPEETTTEAPSSTESSVAESSSESSAVSESSSGESSGEESAAAASGESVNESNSESSAAASESSSSASSSSSESSEAAATTKNVADMTPDEIYVYNPGDGGFVWVDADDPILEADAFNLDDYQLFTNLEIPVEKIYSKFTVTSNNWFATKVLELTSTSSEASQIKVITVTAAELESRLLSTSSDKISLNDVDLLYLSGTSALNLSSLSTTVTSKLGTYGGDNDISWDTAFNIYEYLINTNLPIIMDYTVLSDLEKNKKVTDCNLLRLAELLKLYSAVDTINTYLSDGTSSSAVTSTSSAALWADESSNVRTAIKATLTYGLEGKAAGSVYIKTKDNFVTKNLETVIFNYPESSLADGEDQVVGMTQIAGDIQTDNYYNKAGDFTTEYSQASDGSYKLAISRATLARYIINYAQRRITVYKDVINVLDIEPTKYSNLTESKIKEWLAQSEETQKVTEINITQMTSSEFIGVNDDLCETYDLIYIGGCIGSSNLAGSLNQSNGETVYNDSAMNGMIYTHVGDKVVVDKRFGGLYDSEYNNDKTALSGNITTRYSGNDITEIKRKELKEFADAGYPIVFEDNLMNKNGIVRKHIDNTSNLYQLMDDIKSYKNVTYVSGVSSQLVQYINMPKLYLSMISVPTEYSVTYTTSGSTKKIDKVVYLQKEGDKYYLNYTFEFSDTSKSTSADTYYTAELFIDTNADGSYSDSEELDGLTITRAATGEQIEYNKLEAGVRYNLKRQLPSDYVGMLPWNLRISMSTNKNVRVSSTGYTAIESTAKEVIRVLQICADGLYSSENGTPNTSYVLRLDTNATFQKLFQEMYDKMNLDIQVTTITVKEYLNMFNKDNYNTSQKMFTNYLDANYDMLMMGYQDCYTDIDSDTAIEAISMFIRSGKAVLFSHDTTSYINVDKTVLKKSYGTSPYSSTWSYFYWGYHMNKFVRSLVGMDRYNVTSTDTANDDATYSYLDSANKLYSVTLNGQEHGFTNFILEDKNQLTYKSRILSGVSEDYSRTTTITQVNDGQITNYPYDINITDSTGASRGITTTNVSSTSRYGTSTSYSTVSLPTSSVATTHAQYYQLDMEDDDIVVWYCLSGGEYSDSPNDVRNNYYIYSKGNVTYTGMGHNTAVTDDEARLFINTMVASYNTAAKSPSITLTDEEDSTDSLNYIYRTYDDTLDLEDKSDVKFYYTLLDTNIIEGTKTYTVTFYNAVTSTDSYDITTVDSNGNTVYLKKISSTEYKDSGTNASELNLKTQSVVLKGNWINENLGASSDGELLIYVGVKTTLNYSTEKDPVTTQEGFASFIIKERSLFKLD